MWTQCSNNSLRAGYFFLRIAYIKEQETKETTAYVASHKNSILLWHQ